MEWTFGWWQVRFNEFIQPPHNSLKLYNQAASWWHQQLRLLGYSYAYESYGDCLKTAIFCLTGKTIQPFVIVDGNSSIQCYVCSNSQFSSPDYRSGSFIGNVQYSPPTTQAGKPCHQLYQSDVNTLPFADENFDAVINAHMLEHLPNPAQGLREMVRVLRPDPL